MTFEKRQLFLCGRPGKECLKNVSLEIRSGETVGILGGTGTSKSTLVQLIPRLYDATEGRVLVGGVDVRDYDMEALREQVAMVLQKMCSSPAPSRKTSAGARRMPRMRSWSGSASWLRQTPSSRSFQTSTTRILSRAERMYPAVRSSGFALPGPC